MTVRTLSAADLLRGVPTTPTARRLGHPLPAEPCSREHRPIVLEDGRDLLCGRDVKEAP